MSKELGSTESLGRQSSRSTLLTTPSPDDILDKLKYINYTSEFLLPFSIQPFTRFSFTHPTNNTNEQFYHFVLLVCYLLKKCGVEIETPNQFDDPNATCANIITAIKTLGITDISPSKLKQGYGDGIVAVLGSLLDLVEYKFEQPVHKLDEYPEEATVDYDAEVTTETIAHVDDLVEEEVFYPVTTTQTVQETKVDPSEWRLEVERVTPLLKVIVNEKDWRLHVSQITTHQARIKSQMTETQSKLTTVAQDIDVSLEKITSREKYINAQFQDQIVEHQRVLNQVSVLKQRISVTNTSVSQLSLELVNVSDTLERVKERMDELGSGMTDSKPLIAIKQGSVKIKVM
jgi:estrogen-related receptor beta like 1